MLKKGFLAFLFLALPLGAAERSREARIARVEAIGMTVSDMDRAIDFYTRVLTFEKVSDREVHGEDFERLQGIFGSRLRIVRMELGDEEIELTEYLTPRGRPIPADARSNDLWFQHVAIIVGDMDAAYQRLREHKVQHSSPAPQRLPDWNPNAGGIEAFYFKDPDGRPLEILEFPEGKGDPKWRALAASGTSLFLGIDHTAIAVSDTEQSLEFYRDHLGFEMVGRSENYGPEQERLNNVFGARLLITALRAGSGPGIELLEYLAPGDGRLMPADERANDLIHWQTVLESDAARGLASELLGEAPFVSPGVVEIDEPGYPYPEGFLVRDPDGHVLQVMQSVTGR
jgi:catechol 2,3-dioxygenase-like lactoylglutathione lyase family enzyme